MNFSGVTNFEYMVERFVDPIGGLLPYDETESEDYIEVKLNVEGRAYFRSGKYSGPWEESYPDEGETEIISIVDSEGKDWEDKLTASEKEELMDIIVFNCGG